MKLNPTSANVNMLVSMFLIFHILVSVLFFLIRNCVALYADKF